MYIRRQHKREVERQAGDALGHINTEQTGADRILSLMKIVDALALESHISVKMVAEHITEAITQAAGYPFVGLLTRSSQTREELVLSGWSGSDWLGRQTDSDLGLGRPLHVRLMHPWFAEIERSRLISVDSLSDAQIGDFLGCSPSDIKEVKSYARFRSLYAVKLVARRRIVGLLLAGYDAPAGELGPTDTELLDQISDSIGVALDNKLLYEENRHLLHQLEESSAKLVALDEAKDDFISMASHQLRTPLTSVKGYTSMVLEGDAGKITPAQRKLLSQSFASAQRMVYLIADLLNVSRLKTGKFILDPTPVDLAEVVKEELEQLKETAAIRSLKISYARPKKFPTLMLDETKIRQVVMNFADNAIYYTPAKGEIEVSLSETPSTIEFRVKDNGIGVPRSEQHHLFTKFYRAGNARKARPDGTGLGLFMAKKIVIAQGGAIIFDSKEGKGSTFGFIFSKRKLEDIAKRAEKSGEAVITP